MEFFFKLFDGYGMFGFISAPGNIAANTNSSLDGFVPKIPTNHFDENQFISLSSSMIMITAINYTQIGRERMN